MKQNLIVIGNGMAGVKAVEEIIAILPDKFHIHIFGDEPFGNYNRVLLSNVLSGDQAFNNITINEESWYETNNIVLHSGADNKVIAINRKDRLVATACGEQYAYDRLIIATGSNPYVAPVEGIELKGVTTFRTIQDVEKMLGYTDLKQHAVVQGGGLLGLEAAFGLAKRGMTVTVLHNRDYLLNRQLDEEAGRFLQRFLEQNNIHFVFADSLNELAGNDIDHVKEVRLASGRAIPCDLFVVATGIQPNIALAEFCGLYCEKGIVVSDAMQTYDPAIYAVGECTEHRGKTFGMVAPLYQQAKVLANHITGPSFLIFKSSPPPTKLKVAGVNLFSMGDFKGEESTEQLFFKDPDRDIYKKLVIKGKRLVGAILYGDITDANWYQDLIIGRVDIRSFRSVLIFGKTHYQQYFSGLSDAADVVMQNKNITKVA